MLLNRQLRTQLTIAILFVALGAGNIIFGTYRAKEYRKILFQASQVVTVAPPDEIEVHSLPRALTQAPLRGGPSSYLSQIRARYDFYLFVTIGGKWMLALAGFFLLLSLVGMADSNAQDSG